MSVLLSLESENSDFVICDWKGKEIACFVESEGEKKRLFLKQRFLPSDTPRIV